MTGERGFLVLEVLIAGLILTASIAASMYLFKVGFENLQRANDSNVVSIKLPQAVNLVKTLDLQGEGGTEDLGDGVRLIWQPKLLDRRRTVIRDAEIGNSPSNFEVSMYRVKIVLDYKNLGREYFLNVFQYRTLDTTSLAY